MVGNGVRDGATGPGDDDDPGHGGDPRRWWAADAQLRAAATVLEDELRSVDADRMTLLVSQEEYALRRAATQRLSELESRMTTHLEAQVGSLLAEKAAEMEACGAFQRELEQEMEALQGVIRVLGVRRQELAGAYEAAVRELQEEHIATLAAARSQVWAETQAEVQLLRQAARDVRK